MKKSAIVLILTIIMTLILVNSINAVPCPVSISKQAPTIKQIECMFDAAKLELEDKITSCDPDDYKAAKGNEQYIECNEQQMQTLIQGCLKTITSPDVNARIDACLIVPPYGREDSYCNSLNMCFYGGRCILVGERFADTNYLNGNGYCTKEEGKYKLAAQKLGGEVCNNIYECLSNKCTNNICDIYQNISLYEQCKTGCVVDNECVNVGHRYIHVAGEKNVPVYCGAYNNVIQQLEQKQNNAECKENYECILNQCTSEKCFDVNAQPEKSQSIFDKVIIWFKNLFN